MLLEDVDVNSDALGNRSAFSLDGVCGVLLSPPSSVTISTLSFLTREKLTEGDIEGTGV